MSLMDAPAYDTRRAHTIRALLIGLASLIVLLILLTLLGYILGHGWLFSNLPAEHKVNEFYTALQNRDYPTAYGLYENDPQWQGHPDQHRTSSSISDESRAPRFTTGDFRLPSYSGPRRPAKSLFLRPGLFDPHLGARDRGMGEATLGAGAAFTVKHLGDQEDLAARKAADRRVVAVPVFPDREVVLVEKPHLAIVGQAGTRIVPAGVGYCGGPTRT